jgi:uncharacterized protein YpmS
MLQSRWTWSLVTFIADTTHTIMFVLSVMMRVAYQWGPAKDDDEREHDEFQVSNTHAHICRHTVSSSANDRRAPRAGG